MTDEDFQKLWTHLVERVHRPGGLSLSEHEKHFYAVNFLRGSVPRSGFIGYFENRQGSEISDAREGLRALDLESVLSVFEEALAAVLGGRAVPADSSRIEIFPDDLTDDELEAASDQLDELLTPIAEKFYGYEDEMWEALVRYADAHQLKPRS